MTRPSEPGQLAVTVNGVASTLTVGTTLGQLLAQLGIASERVAVEVNLSVIERSVFHAKALEDGDRVEIVSFVGGGHG